MLLTLLIFLPLVYALIVVFLSEKSVRPVSLGLSIFHFLLSLLMLVHFNSETPALQLVEKISWIPTLGTSYFVGVDGISLWLVILTTFLTPLTLLGCWTSIHEKVRGFHIAMFTLMSSMIGTFLAFDAILFYVFFEVSLIPMYFMIGIWGGPRRIYATLKFFIYTMFGSLFMLIAIITLMFLAAQQNGGQLTSNLLELYKLKIPFVAGEFLNTQTLLFFAFALAFAIKMPLFPFHTWLPDAHVEAPTPGSVILAGVMLKMGSYGFLRLCMPLFPQAVEYYAWLFMSLGVIGIVYGALVAMVQPDMKKLVAYSSVSHMGYVMLGLFAMNSYGVSGGVYQMLNHGISTGALFLLVGMIYERTHTREISKYGGLAKVAPWFSIAFIIITMSSIAVPGTNGFVGEFLILLGSFGANRWLTVVAVTGVIFGATYMLWMVKKIFFGEEGEIIKEHGAAGLDLNLRDWFVLVPLIVLVFVMGLYPDMFLKMTKSSVQNLIDNRYNYELTIYDGVTPPKAVAQESQHGF